MITHLNQDNFKDFINQDEIVLIDFWATWCSPCRMIAHELEILDSKGYKIGKVDVDEESIIASIFNVEAIPTLILIKHGKLLDKRVGFVNADALEAWIKNYQ